MSKTALKRTLRGMSRDEVEELLLDLYDARREAKEYLEFFLNPDIGKLMEKCRAAIVKEVARSGRYRWRNRVSPKMSKVRKTVKDLASFNPGPEYPAELMTYFIEGICKGDAQVKEATRKSIVKFLDETLVYIDRHQIFDDFIGRIERAVGNMEPRAGFRSQMREALDDRLAMREGPVSTEDR